MDGADLLCCDQAGVSSGGAKNPCSVSGSVCQHSGTREPCNLKRQLLCGHPCWRDDGFFTLRRLSTNVDLCDDDRPVLIDPRAALELPLLIICFSPPLIPHPF